MYLDNSEDILNSNNGEFEEQTTFPNKENVKRRTVVGPWKNVAEFNKVYEWLFGEQYSIETRQLALSQISIWNLRRSTLCPAAVLATSVIIEVQLKDKPDTVFSREDLQTFYSHAFTRFFNFMSSIIQSHNMRTMYQTAKELGLQSFVVDLRHICAHGQTLPPLEVLRNTAEYCICWLHDYYWSTQRNTMCDVDATRIRRKDKTQFDDSVTELFQIYDSALEGHMKGATNLKSLKRHLHGKRFSCLKGYLTENKLTSLQDSFDHIVKQLCCLVKRDVAIKDLSEIYIEALLKMRFFFTLADSYKTDADRKSLISATQTLFRMMAIYGFLEDLFLSLIEITENPIAERNRRLGASFWGVEIAKGFTAFRRCKQMYKAELDEDSTIKETPFSTTNLTEISEGTRELYVYSGVDMKRTLLFGDHFQRPWVWVFERNFLEERLEAVNEYTAPILKSLFPLIVPEFSTSQMKTLSTLIDCVFIANAESEDNDKMSEDPTNITDNGTVYTAQDLLKKLSKNKDLGMEVENGTDITDDELNKQTYGLWSVVPDDESHDWKTCPLGRLPWE